MGLKEIKEKTKLFFRDKSNSHLDVNICMLGSKGVGKTSVLTAIFDDARSKDGLLKTKIYLQAKNETRIHLAKHREKLIGAFFKRTDIAAIPPNKSEDRFYFELGLLGSMPCVDMEISDYPGEKLVDDPEFVASKIKESEVVIVAVDSPYLMEEDGRYNDHKNKVETTSSFIIDNIDSFKDKLIMIVPLKCEKYFELKPDGSSSARSLNELTRKIESTYATLIDAVKSQEDIALMIAPILTVGGAVFDHFEECVDEKGMSYMNARYRFYDGETSDGINAKYQPLFCVQPIFHLLSFLAQKYNRARKNTGLIGTLLQSVYDFFNNNKEFLEEMVEIDKRRLKDRNGFKIICGNNLFYSKNN